MDQIHQSSLKSMKNILVGVFIVMTVFLIHYPQTTTQALPTDHLPANVQPEKYNLRIDTNPTNDEPKFWGTVNITVKCVGQTDLIILNQKDLRIRPGDVLVRCLGNPLQSPIGIKSQDKDDVNERFIVILEKSLEAEKSYEIEINFSKNVFSEYSGYITQSFGYLLGNPHGYGKRETFTKIDEFEAREVFPCFDEMDMKAKFKIQLAHSDTIKGFSNGKLIFNKHSPEKPGWVLDEFEETPPMAPFSVAFALLDYESKSFVDPDSKFEIQVLANNDGIGGMNFTLANASRIFAFFSEYFQVSCELKTLDIIILYGFFETVKGNYGFIIINENSILDAVQGSTDSAEFQIVSEMCNAISEQWIGNLVTMSQWNEQWLHFGLNFFLQTTCINKEFPDWEFTFSESRIVEWFDQLLTSQAERVFDKIFIREIIMFFEENIADDTGKIEKGHYLIRMMNFFLGPDVFKMGIFNYLKRFKFANSTLVDVWNEFSAVAEEANILPEGLKIRTIMESWTFQKGYPLITVVRDYETKEVSVTQELFVNQKEINNHKATTECWIFPLTYTTKTMLDYKNVRFSEWVTCDGPLKLSFDDLNHDNWIIFNLGINVLARVNYDQRNWLLIQKSFLNDYEYLDFDYLTRVHLISDMFALAEAGKLSYQFLFNTMNYLRKELSYEPLKMALKEFNKMRSRLFGTSLFKSYEKYVREILKKLFNTENYKMIDKHSRNSSADFRSQQLIIELSCIFGVVTCGEQSLEFTKIWISSSMQKKLDLFLPQIVQTILCHGIKYGDANDWKSLWSQYVDLNIAGKLKCDVLSALGCSTDTRILERYLEMSIDRAKVLTSDSMKIFRSLSSNEKGYKLMKKFLVKQYDKILAFYSGKTKFIRSYINILLDATTRRKDLKELLEFVKSKELYLFHDDSNNDLEESIRNSLKNIVWFEKSEESLKSYFHVGILNLFSKVKKL